MQLLHRDETWKNDRIGRADTVQYSIPSAGNDPNTVRILNLHEEGWVAHEQQGPDARWGHAMAYDVARRVAVLFGGWDGQTEFADTWAWDGDRWIEQAPESAPPPRFEHALAYDAGREVTVLFGGGDEGGRGGDEGGERCALKESWRVPAGHGRELRRLRGGTDARTVGRSCQTWSESSGSEGKFFTPRCSFSKPEFRWSVMNLQHVLI